MIVTFPGVADPFFIEIGNQLAIRSPDGQLASYKILGDDFIKLVNSSNTVYMMANSTTGISDENWESIVASNTSAKITRTIVWFYDKLNPNASYGCFRLYGFTCSADAALFKLTWL